MTDIELVGIDRTVLVQFLCDWYYGVYVKLLGYYFTSL